MKLEPRSSKDLSRVLSAPPRFIEVHLLLEFQGIKQRTDSSMERNTALRKMRCQGWWRRALKQKQCTIKITLPTPQFCLVLTLLYSPEIVFQRIYSCSIYQGCFLCFQWKISVIPIDNFQTYAAHSNSLLIPHILLTVNGTQNSIQPCSTDRS